MRRGDRSRAAILDAAINLASTAGLSGLTIGALAASTGFSKSGLIAHFGSRRALELETLKAAAERFNQLVVRPAMSAPPGEARLRALFLNWLAWAAETGGPGGCPFVSASADLDDTEGPARDYLAAHQRDWLYSISKVAERAVEAGEFARGTDCRRLAFELLCAYLGYHHARRLLRDPAAEQRALETYERLVAAARA
jgi:AcrR family transcriptional regulator